MKDLLKEIKQFRKFANIKEDISNIKSVVFGDSLAKYIQDEDVKLISSLSSDFLTMNELIIRLNDFKPEFDVDYVFFSIGTDDKFKKESDLFILAKTLRIVFPKSEIYVIRAIVDEDYFYSGFDDDVINNLELKIDDYYKTFEKLGIDVVGTYNTLDRGIGISNQKINIIKNEIAKLILLELTDFEKEPKKEDKPFIEVENKKIDGDDETDFDTIYEFLERFEKIHKSKNEYSRRTNSSFKLDIEQIQVALNFLIYANLEINGRYDLDTENAVADYQFKRGLKETGICDVETIEEIFYNLKIKGFDEDDLGKYIQKPKNEVVEPKKFTGSVDGVWKSFTDKIIDNFEGGYWNNDRTLPIDKKCINHPYDSDLSYNSGETMFGIDRRAGNWDSNQAGRDFFGIIDDEKESAGNMINFCKKWYYNYRGGSLESELKNRASALMKTSYDRNTSYFSNETKKEVESNKRLLFHFAYACWNGSGVFQDFAEEMNRAVSNGMRGDELVDLAVQQRNERYGSGAWARPNQKVVNIIKNDPELEN